MSGRAGLKARFQILHKIQSEIFGTNYNPTNARTGAKVLRERLVGSTIKNYYNRSDLIGFKNFKTLFPQFKFIDADEEYRLSMVAARKRRGKGAPAKTKKK